MLFLLGTLLGAAGMMLLMFFLLALGERWSEVRRLRRAERKEENRRYNEEFNGIMDSFYR